MKLFTTSNNFCSNLLLFRKYVYFITAQIQPEYHSICERIHWLTRLSILSAKILFLLRTDVSFIQPEGNTRLGKRSKDFTDEWLAGPDFTLRSEHLLFTVTVPFHTGIHIFSPLSFFCSSHRGTYYNIPP